MSRKMFQKNDKVRLVITDIGVNGEGVGKAMEQADSPVFFVKNAVIGDEVLAVVTRMKKGYGYTKALEIRKPSPDRVVPACPLAERCGGCQIMQLSYDAQLRFKEEKVRGDLERIAGLSPECMLPILPMEQDPPLHFRNKMQFPVGLDRDGHVVTGFYAGRTHYIIEAAQCPVSPQVNEELLEGIRRFLDDHKVSVYREETGEGLVRHILIRNGFHTGQILVCLVLNGSRLEAARGERGNAIVSIEPEFVNMLTKLKLPDPWKIAGICLNRNRENTNVILGDRTRCLYGTPYIEDVIRSQREDLRPLQFRINPRSFFQTNPEQTTKLYDAVLKLAGLTGTETVWDLYCGIGTISLFLAQQARQVYGVEIIPEAIEDAKENALRNGITNAEFFCGKSEEVFPEKAAHRSSEAENGEAADVVVLDPPRKGCAKELLEAICQVGPDRIVYVSCDPATLARDLKFLCGQGYRLDVVQAADMFPHTVHVEVVSLLSRSEATQREA